MVDTNVLQRCCLCHFLLLLLIVAFVGTPELYIHVYNIFFVCIINPEQQKNAIRRGSRDTINPYPTPRLFFGSHGHFRFLLSLWHRRMKPLPSQSQRTFTPIRRTISTCPLTVWRSNTHGRDPIASVTPF